MGSPRMAKNSQKSPNGDWTKVPKKTTTTSTKLGSSTLKLADSRRSCRRNSSSQKKNGKGPAKKLFTRDTKQVHVRPDVVKFVFRAEKRSQFKKAEKPKAKPNKEAIDSENDEEDFAQIRAQAELEAGVQIRKDQESEK